MSAVIQLSNVRCAVMRLSTGKSSPERLVLAYPNEETVRGLIADTSLVGLGFHSRDEAACAASADVAEGMKTLRIRRLAASLVHLATAAVIFTFYSKNIVSATVRAVLAGSL